MSFEIGSLINAAFRTANQIHHKEHRVWVDASIAIGANRPASLLMVNVQRCGDLDRLLRCMEAERVSKLNQASCDFLTDPFHYQCLFSDVWVGSLYAVVRILAGRGGIDSQDKLRDLAHKLRIIRVPLEKLEIAGDNGLTEPIQFVAAGPGAEPLLCEYDRKDPKRSHIMRTGVSARGSLMWEVFDVTAKGAYWLERLQLSDQFLEVFYSDDADPSLAEKG